MKRHKAITPIVIVILLCVAHPETVSAKGVHAFQYVSSTETAGTSLHSLAPQQRDINIAIMAVILGNLLIGYEQAAHQRSLKKHGRQTPRNYN